MIKFKCVVVDNKDNYRWMVWNLTPRKNIQQKKLLEEEIKTKKWACQNYTQNNNWDF